MDIRIHCNFENNQIFSGHIQTPLNHYSLYYQLYPLYPHGWLYIQMRCRNWQRSVFISRPFHTQQSVMGIIFVWDMCVRGKWGHCCLLLCFFFLGQGVFFDQKQFFSIIKSMGRAGFVVIKKNRKTDITCVFLSMNFLTSKICMFCIMGHQIIVFLAELLSLALNLRAYWGAGSHQLVIWPLFWGNLTIKNGKTKSIISLGWVFFSQLHTYTTHWL